MLVFCSNVMLQLCSADRHASAGMLFVAVFWWTMCRTVLASLYRQPLAQQTCARWLAQFAEQVLRPTLGTSLVSCTRVTSVTELLHHGKGPRDLAEQLLHGLGLADGGFSLQPR